MDLEKKLEQIKPYQLNCNVFSVYDYPNTYSIQELLNKFFDTINNCVELCNNVLDLAKWLVTIGLEQEVANKLQQWLEDGTLEKIINDKLFNSLNEKINGMATQLENIYVEIDKFPRLENEVDDTNRIKRCFEYCKTNNKIPYSQIKNYEISDTIQIDINANLSNATFTSNCCNVSVLVGGENKTINLNIQLPDILNSKENYEGIGVRVQNVYESKIYFKKIQGFSVGSHFTANNNLGCVYNQFFLMSNINNKTLLLIETLDLSGWVNQNTFYGGRLYNSYDMLNLFDKEQIKYIHLKGNSTHPINNNVFINTCVESLKGYKIYAEHSSHNTFMSCRYEGDAKDVVYSDCMFNAIINGYGASELIIQDDRTRNILITPDKIVMASSHTDGFFTLRNTSSDNNPSFVIENINKNKSISFGVNNGIEIFKDGFQHPLYKINTNGLYMGDGNSTPAKRIRDYGENIRFEQGNLEVINKYIILDGYYIWFDSNGLMRRKKGKPTTDEDGVVIGSQG